MDSDRAAKRRRLDTTSKSSPASQSRSAPITYSKKQKAKLKDIKSAAKAQAALPKGPSASHLNWQEAKANLHAQRRKTGSTVRPPHGVSVYDDIEGAHGERTDTNNESVSSTPRRKQLDPLRNQRSGGSATSSPSKPSTSLNFFKQFAKPLSQSQESPEKPKASAEKKVNGVKKPAKVDLKSQAVSGAEAEESEHEDVPLESPDKPGWKGWAYSTGPKKTLEDEIRELGNAAREQADEDEDDVPAERSSRRKRNTPSKLGESEDLSNVSNVSAQHKSVKSETPKQTPLVNKLKLARKDARKSTTSAAEDTEDAMDIDELAVMQPEEPLTTNGVAHLVQSEDSIKPTPQQRSKPKLSSAATFSSENLLQIQSILLQKLDRQRRTQLVNLDAEYNKVSALVTQTITAGESNSMLLIGARGSGKSALVDQILYEQAQKHADDFLVVRLNGFIHTDDKIALREIWRQLGREMELEGDDSASKNYADTLTTLLALLSHPAELGQEQSAGHITKSVVFIIDEFDLFANHPRQTLLYNLFDIAQSRKAPIAVLGLTTRIDAAESLEKRVKSRFSHRYVHLGFAKSLNAFQDACKPCLSLHFDELIADERERLGAKTEVTEKLSKASKKQKEPVLAQWNHLMDDLFEDESFATRLKRIYYTTKSVPDFQTSMLLPISTLAVEQPVSATDLLSHLTTTTSSLSPPDSNLTILPSLSTLHLALLISAARLTNIHATDIVPFNQCYEEYKTLASKQKFQQSASGAVAQGAGTRVWSKDVARGAWEDLVAFGLIVEEARGGRCDVGLEEIGLCGVDLGGWGRWCREI